MTHKVKAQNPHFKGERFGLRFFGGESEEKELTTRQYDWFVSHGYEVVGDRPNEPAKPKNNEPAKPKE